MATPPVGQIKEVNHSGDDLSAFQVKEQFFKKWVKKYSVLSLQVFPGSLDGLVWSPPPAFTAIGLFLVQLPHIHHEPSSELTVLCAHFPTKKKPGKM